MIFGYKGPKIEYQDSEQNIEITLDADTIILKPDTNKADVIVQKSITGKKYFRYKGDYQNWKLEIYNTLHKKTVTTSSYKSKWSKLHGKVVKFYPHSDNPEYYECFCYVNPYNLDNITEIDYLVLKLEGNGYKELKPKDNDMTEEEEETNSQGGVTT